MSRAQRASPDRLSGLAYPCGVRLLSVVGQPTPSRAVPVRAFSGISEMLPDAVVVADARRRVVEANGRCRSIVGMSPAELIGHDICQVLAMTDSDGRDWWALTDPWRGLTTRTGHREKLLVVRGVCEVLVTARYVRPARGAPTSHVVLSLRDPLARKRAEAEFGMLITTMAHELRSPLTSVKGFSASLLAHWDQFSDDQKRFIIETIGRDADRLTRLITELLDLSRLDAGRLPIHPAALDPGELIARHLRRAEAAGSGADRFVLRVEAPAMRVWADPDRFDQIMANLLENAVRHGAGTITTTVREGAPGDEAMAYIEVCDEGPGIDEAISEQIFNRFWHAARGGSGAGSTGLGLYLVRGLCEAQGGAVAVSRGPRGGACFTVTLPTVPAHA